MFLRFLLLSISSLFYSFSLLGQACDCKEYVYLNEPEISTVLKFEITNNIELTQVSGANGLPPWFSSTTLFDRNHGVATDLNGRLYIGSDNQAADNFIYQFSCDGTYLPGFELDPNHELNNMFSIGNTLYTTADRTGNTAGIVAYDLCTGQELGELCIQDENGSTSFGGTGSQTWGLAYNKVTEMIYRTTRNGSNNSTAYVYAFSRQQLEAGIQDPNICISPLIFPGNIEIPVVGDNLIPNVGTFSNVLGVVGDDDGNIYVVVYFSNLTSPLNTYIYKYDSSGGFIARSGLIGRQGHGIGWSRTTNRLYVASFTDDPNADCIRVVDAATLNDLGTGAPNPNLPIENDAKALAIVTECCPTQSELILSETICSDGNGEPIFLQEIFSCGDGIICEGQWSVETPNANHIFNPCDLSITVNGGGCGTYVLQKTTGVGNGQRCNAFRIELEVCTEVPEATLIPNQGTCEGSIPNNDATISFSNLIGDEVNFSIGSSYNGPAYGDGTNIDVSSGTGNLTGLMHNSLYTLRVFNGANDCFVDETVTIPSINCSLPCNLTDLGETLKTCNDNTTNTDPSDDYLSFSLDPIGTAIGATYSVTANNGGIVTLATGGPATGINYGGSTAFRLQNGSADGITNFTITVTDVEDLNCVQTFILNALPSCSSYHDCEFYSTLIENNCCQICETGNVYIRTAYWREEFLNLINQNLALNKPAMFNATPGLGNSNAHKATDGELAGQSINSFNYAFSNGGENNYLDIDLVGKYDLDTLKIHTKTGCCNGNANNYRVFISETPFPTMSFQELLTQTNIPNYLLPLLVNENPTIHTSLNKIGRFVRIYLEGTGQMQIVEIEVIGSGRPDSNPYQYNWNDPNIGNTPNPDCLSPGEYQLTITDVATGCTSLSTVEVNN